MFRRYLALWAPCALSLTVFAATAAADALITPIAIERGFLNGIGLSVGDASEFDDEGISSESGEPAGFMTHTFHSGKLEVSVYETAPGKVRVDGLPYDEFILILEGRLILSTDDGQQFEFEEGDSLLLPKGFVGYWDMPEKYRELIVIDTSYKDAMEP